MIKFKLTEAESDVDKQELDADIPSICTSFEHNRDAEQGWGSCIGSDDGGSETKSGDGLESLASMGADGLSLLKTQSKGRMWLGNSEYNTS